MIRKLIRHEWLRLKSQRAMALTCVLAYVAFLLFCLVYFYSSPLQKGYDNSTLAPPEPVQRIEFLQNCQPNMERLELSMADTERYTERQIEEMRREYQQYRFYLETQTVPWDYLNQELYTFRYKGLEAAGFALFLSKLMIYPAILLASMLTAWIFASEYEDTLKNVLAAPVRRKQLFGGKLAFAGIAFAAVLLFPFLLCLLFALCGGNAAFLLYTGGRWRAVSVAEYALKSCLGTASCLALLLGVSLIAGVFSQKSFAAFFAGTLSYALFFLISIMLSYSAPQGISPVSFLPYMGLQNHGGGFDLTFVAMALCHLAAGAGLIFAAMKKFLRQDI